MTAKTRVRYDRIAPLYDRLESRLERTTYSRWREHLWRYTRGSAILELGVGTGKNRRFYPSDVHVIGIDLSSQMIAHANARMGEARSPTPLAVMDIQHLAFPDATFDTLVGTFVFGSVPDPVQGLRQARRVAKPEGRLLLLEYVRPSGLMGFLVDLLNPLITLVYGANINRHTLANVQRAGWEIIHVEGYWHGLVQFIVARPSMSDVKRSR